MNKKKGLIIAIAVAVVLVAVLLILIFVPKGGESDAKKSTIDEGIAMAVSTDKNGVHQAEIKTDKDGKIANNSYGTLMQYYPANLKGIHVENKKGSFDISATTPKGESTVYTLKGFEGYDLKSDSVDLIANSAASLSFTKVATLDKSKGSEYGFDKPRSTVTVTYEDKTKAIITVGSDAPQAAGTYIKFGTGDTVYVISTDLAAVFDYGITDLMSLEINKAPSNTDNGQASSIKLAGTAFDKAIELVPNTNENYSASYMLTAPVSRIANESESSKIEGAIRGLYADSVKMVNPSASQLSELGLSNPYARLTAVYPDTTVELLAAKPDGDGNVNLMVGGGKIVYTLSADKAAWTRTSYSKLCSEYVLYPKLTALSGVTVKADGKTYDFALNTKEKTTTDDSGEETTTTETSVKYKNEEIQIGDFSTFYDAVSLIALADADTGSAGGKQVLSVTYRFADGSSDSVEFLDAGGDKYAAKLNGSVAGHSHKVEVTAAVKAVAELTK